MWVRVHKGRKVVRFLMVWWRSVVWYKYALACKSLRSKPMKIRAMDLTKKSKLS
jgi:hypothetical protein